MSSGLVKELQSIIDPTPSHFDPDEDIDDLTQAKLVDNIHEVDENDAAERFGSLRNKVGTILSHEDDRYKGKVTKRYRISSDVDELSGDDDDDDGDYLAADPVSSNVKEGGASDDHEDGIDSAGDEDPGGSSVGRDEDDAVEMDDDDEEDENGGEVAEGQPNLLQTFSHVDLQDEHSKAKSVQAQLKLWEQLLAARIRLQRVTSLINQLPQGDDGWRSFASEASGAAEGDAKLSGDGKRRLKSILDHLINFQNELWASNGATKNLPTDRTPSVGGVDSPSPALDSDEEILSSPDESDDGGKVEAPRAKIVKKSYKMADYPNVLAKRDADFRPYRDKVLLHWYEKTKLASGKIGGRNDFSAFDKNILKQIEQVLSDEKRLIKRTQLKRSDYRVLGKRTFVADQSKSVENAETEINDEYDEEIFDDDDFYHQLLREIIERKASGVTDPHALGRQWLEVQKLRSKAKKKLVDRKASKARKIRYDILPKLVNFMAPIDRNNLAYDSRQELFKSLFNSTTT